MGIPSYHIVTLRNESYVVLEITEAFAKLAKASLKIEGNDWLTLFTEPTIKGRVSIAENISRPFYVKIIPDQLSSSILAHIIYIRLVVKHKDLTSLIQTDIETLLNNYMPELSESYALIGKDKQQLILDNNDILTSIKNFLA